MLWRSLKRFEPITLNNNVICSNYQIFSISRKQPNIHHSVLLARQKYTYKSSLFINAYLNRNDCYQYLQYNYTRYILRRGRRGRRRLHFPPKMQACPFTETEATKFPKNITLFVPLDINKGVFEKTCRVSARP